MQLQAYSDGLTEILNNWASGTTGPYLWLCVRPNLPAEELPITAQAEQVVSKNKQLQNGVCVTFVTPMPVPITRALILWKEGSAMMQY